MFKKENISNIVIFLGLAVNLLVIIVIVIFYLIR